MKKYGLRMALIGTAFVFLLGIGPVAVLAHEHDGSSDEVTTTTAAEDEQKPGSDDRGGALKERLKALKEQRQEMRQKRLEANKLRVCQQRKVRIAAIMSRGDKRAERHLELFGTIAERVKAFYEDKGRTISNYDELVAAVDAAKAKAQADIETLKGLEPFNCDAEDPKGNAEVFKLALKTVKQDLKDYRTAVKNLIVGVKSAQGQTSREGGEL
jgi:hypothetical protein